MPGWINYKLESRLLGEKSIISDMQMIPLQIKRHLLLGRKAITNLGSILKSRDISLPTKVHIVKAVVFSLVIGRCEIWTIKKAECQTIDAFEL